MKKLIFILGLFLLFATNLWAASPTRVYTYTTGEIIAPDKVTNNEDVIFNYLTTGVDTYADGSIVNADISGSAAITYGKLSLGSSLLTGDIKDGEIVNADISSSAAISSSKISGGVVLPSGAVFFMISGSCPSGTTDVTTTYSNKFVRINATGGSTGGADTHTHAAGSYAGPSHTHAVTGNTGNPTYIDGNTYPATAADNVRHTHSVDITSAAGGTGAVTGTSASGDNVPAYVTCKMCQVD